MTCNRRRFWKSLLGSAAIVALAPQIAFGVCRKPQALPANFLEEIFKQVALIARNEDDEICILTDQRGVEAIERLVQLEMVRYYENEYAERCGYKWCGVRTK